MKTLLLAFVCVAASVGAAAQSYGGGAMNAQPQMLVMPDYTQHASQTPLATSQDLLEHSGSSSAHGEVPLWEAMEPAPVTPLGDLARELRKEHAVARKAVKVWTN